MWFVKWFGGRDRADDTDEPARHAPPVVKDLPATPPAAPGAAAPVKARLHGELKKGFDPYNSGVFERANAWERVKHR